MPRIVFATALPVGVESLSEIVDIEFEGRIPPLEVRERLNQVLPKGIRITEAEEVPVASSSSSLLRRSVYWIQLDPLVPKEEAMERIRQALKDEPLIVEQERKGKPRRVDVRPLIERLEVTYRSPRGEKVPDGEGEREAKENNRWGIELVLLRGWGKTAKPSEIVGAVLGLKEASLSQCEIVKVE